MKVVRTSRSCKTPGSIIDSYDLYEMFDKVCENVRQQPLPMNITIGDV